MKEDNHAYNANDFARYHAGAMPPDEMHALEKAALEDPFLADALEGYVFSHDAENELSDIKMRLGEKSKRKKAGKVVSLSTSAWWRIAAMFIVIAGVGYFFYQAKDMKMENAVARNERQSEKEKLIARIQMDSTTVKSDMAFEKSQPGKEQTQAQTILPPSNARVEKNILETTPHRKISEAPARLNGLKGSPFAESVTQNSVTVNDSIAQKRFILKGKVIDEEGDGIAFAEVNDKSNNQSAATDSSGQFYFRSSDSNAIVVATAPGYNSKKIQIQNNAPATISMNKRKAAFDEVAVSDMEQQRRTIESTNFSKTLKAKVAGIEIAKSKPLPLIGQKKFDQYIKENAVPVYNLKGERVNGEIVLSFSLDKNGQPENIKVLKSSCTFCEKEAIRLLKNGPQWTGKQTEQGTVLIKI